LRDPGKKIAVICFFPKWVIKNLPEMKNKKKALEGIHSEFLYTLPHKHRIGQSWPQYPKKYSTDAKNQKQAVIVDLETFKWMESIIEDNGLFKIHGRSKKRMRPSFVREAKKHHLMAET